MEVLLSVIELLAFVAFKNTTVNFSRFFCLYLLFWSRMTSGCFLRYLLFCSRKISGCFSRYLFLCSRCFRFISINSMRGSLFTLSSSTSVLSSCVLSSFTASLKVPSSWRFKTMVRSSKPSLSLLFCHLKNGLKLRVKPRFTC